MDNGQLDLFSIGQITDGDIGSTVCARGIVDFGQNRNGIIQFIFVVVIHLPEDIV